MRGERDDVFAVADALVDAVVKGDAELMRSTYSPDVEVFYNNDGRPMNRDAAVESFSGMRSLIHDVSMETLDRQLTDHGYVTQQVMHFAAPDGTRMAVRSALITRVEDGHIVKLDEYFDSRHIDPLIAQVSGGSQPPPG